MTATFDIDEVRAGSRDTLFGERVFYHPVVDSTNRVAHDLVLERSRKLAVFTDFQEAGRGRQGRTWVAPAGSSLLGSVALKIPPRVPPNDMSMLGALAVAAALEPLGLQPSLKWPNDVLLGDRKVAGILAESVSTSGGGFAIVGMGLNVNFDPGRTEGVPETATSVQIALGRSVSREGLAVNLLRAVTDLYRGAHDDPDTIFDEWKRRLVNLGRSVTVHEPRGAWTGIAEAVERDGSLRVTLPHGESRTVHAADVSVRSG